MGASIPVGAGAAATTAAGAEVGAATTTAGGAETGAAAEIDRGAEAVSAAKSAADIEIAAEAGTAAPAADLGRLRWRCRRGMRELDVLLERYVDERFRGASGADQRAFIELLDTQDTVIYAYCLGQEQPPPRFAGLIEQITAKSSDGR